MVPGLAIASFVATLLLTSCGSDERGLGSGMMGERATPAQGMTGVVGRYSYSRPRCSAPASLPGSTIVVSLADMGMTQMMRGDAPMGVRMMLHASPSRVHAGRVSIVAPNLGWRMHEVVVLPLADGVREGQRAPEADGRVSEAGSVGEVSGSCTAGSGEGIDPGAVGWTTLSLSPGHYELVCNLKNHYINGMHQEIVVY